MIEVAGKGALAAAVLACMAAAPARASDWVSVTGTPSVSGTTRVGSTLTASGGHWSGPFGTLAGFAWLRCTSTDPNSCAPIRGAEATASYTLAGDDQGRRIRVLLWALKGFAFGYAYSNPTAAVAAAPVATPTPTPTRTPVPTPTPTPTRTPIPTPTPVRTPIPTPTPTRTPVPTPTPTRTPVPTPTPVRTPTPTPTPSSPRAAVPSPVLAPVAEPVPAAATVPRARHTPTRARMLRPFPLVRISGRLTADGAHITRLTVTAPRGAHIAVACRGASCPRRRTATIAAVRHIAVFERALRAGTRLTVTVSKRGYIGKVTTITIRRGRPPARRDLCVVPGARHPAACPRR